MIAKRKPKKCGYCRCEFVPTLPMQRVCCLGCAVAIGRRMTDKAKKSAEKAERAADRQRRENLKKRSEYMAEAQTAFNRYIRARDEGMPCICCGQLANDESWKPGGSWDAGHFLGRGAYPELRFEETNCHRQLKSCNAGSSKYARKGRTVSQGYEAGLRARIGDAAVDWLQGPHEAKHYTIDDLKAIKAEYTRKANGLATGRTTERQHFLGETQCAA